MISGLKLLSRKSFEGAAVSKFDNPLSSSFDENDSVLYFDEVKVPWDRVFVHNDVRWRRHSGIRRRRIATRTTSARYGLMVKMRFLLGLARE